MRKATKKNRKEKPNGKAPKCRQKGPNPFARDDGSSQMTSPSVPFLNCLNCLNLDICMVETNCSAAIRADTTATRRHCTPYSFAIFVIRAPRAPSLPFIAAAHSAITTAHHQAQIFSWSSVGTGQVRTLETWAVAGLGSPLPASRCRTLLQLKTVRTCHLPTPVDPFVPEKTPACLLSLPLPWHSSSRGSPF
jgi:hypothetical protein